MTEIILTALAVFVWVVNGLLVCQIINKGKANANTEKRS
jgi:hypothetical protein